jgi:hypothetical protein
VVVRYIIAGQDYHVRLKRVDSVYAVLQVFSADGPAAVEIACVYDSHLLERLRQVAKAELLMYDFEPFGMFAFRTYRPFSAESERAECKAFKIPPAICLIYSNDNCNSLLTSLMQKKPHKRKFQIRNPKCETNSNHQSSNFQNI